MTTPRAVTPTAVALVFVGGTIGTATRAGLTALSTPFVAQPVSTLLINVIGAFLLGLLLEYLSLRPVLSRRNNDLKFLLGTGVLGGFTTYSALAVDTTMLIGHAPAVLGHAPTVLGLAPVVLVAGYALGTLILGAVATAAGILLASTLSRHRLSLYGR